MKKINLIPSILIILCTVSQALAGEVSNLNTFASGQPALASEVNTNFSLIQDAVNDNYARISILENGAGISNGSVTSDIIADGAVTSAKLSADVAMMLATLQSAVSALQSAVASQGATITSLQSDLAIANSTISTLQTDLSNANGVILTLQSDMTTANDTITSLESSLANANGTIDTLQIQLAAIQSNSVLDLDGILTYDTDDNGYPRALFTGVNVQVVNGATEDTVNGVGNLIVGYNLALLAGNYYCSDGAYSIQTDCETNGATWAQNHKSGSHNIVTGSGNNYSSYGGIVFGTLNTVNSPFSSVTGGLYNIASGAYASVSGGQNNTASGNWSSVSAGKNGNASGIYSSVSGGLGNSATADSSSVSSGSGNTASGNISSVSGGVSNTASGYTSSVSGGVSNTASGNGSSVGGGNVNEASGDASTVSGGGGRHVSGAYDWAAGSLFEDY